LSVEQLQRVLPVPRTPQSNGDPESWHNVEKTIGLLLPSDYKDYITMYGDGQIGRFLTPLNPFSRRAATNLMESAPRIIRSYDQLVSALDKDVCPYPFYPEIGGLYPWATTNDGDGLFWLTNGPQDAWPVVVAALETREQVDIYRQSMTSFLADWVIGQLVIEGFPVNLQLPRRFKVIG